MIFSARLCIMIRIISRSLYLCTHVVSSPYPFLSLCPTFFFILSNIPFCIYFHYTLTCFPSLVPVSHRHGLATYLPPAPHVHHCPLTCRRPFRYSRQSSLRSALVKVRAVTVSTYKFKSPFRQYIISHMTYPSTRKRFVKNVSLTFC